MMTSGAPVGKVPFSIQALQGDVEISDVKTTNKRGFAYVTITPGKKEGPVLLRISNDQISTDHLLFQMKETTAPSLQSEYISGSSADRNIVSQWRKSIAFLNIPREENRRKNPAEKSYRTKSPLRTTLLLADPVVLHNWISRYLTRKERVYPM